MTRRERRKLLRKYSKLPKHIKTKLVNKKGEVPSTQTEMFGCEIVKEVPSFLRDFCDEVGLGEFIKVETGKEGFPIGSKGSCHPNVYSLTRTLGGEMLRGYMVVPNGEKYLLFYHSVWITEEDYTICITDLDLGNEYMYIPIGLGLISLKPYLINPLEVNMGENWKQECQIFTTGITYEESKDVKNTYNLQRIKELVRETGGLFTKTPPDEIYFSEKIYLQKADFDKQIYENRGGIKPQRFL